MKSQEERLEETTVLLGLVIMGFCFLVGFVLGLFIGRLF